MLNSTPTHGRTPGLRAIRFLAGIFFATSFVVGTYIWLERHITNESEFVRPIDMNTPIPAEFATTSTSTSSQTTTTATISATSTHSRPGGQKGSNDPSITPVVQEPSAGFKRVITTLFWAGEGATDDNGFIQNFESYWDEDWSTHFGGIDDPEKRCGYLPCGFTPKENPFYIALPYGEYDDGILKANAERIPWYAESQRTKTPLVKNRWVEVRYKGKTCYGQWEDVGPFEEDDFAYVFGDAKPKNQYGEKAGLDVSPALWSCLGMTTNAETEWRFIEAKDVPAGPWKTTITTSGLNWH